MRSKSLQLENFTWKNFQVWQCTLCENEISSQYGHAAAAAAKSLQLCLTPCDPIGGSPPGCSVPGILRARIPKWVAVSFSNMNMGSIVIFLWQNKHSWNKQRVSRYFLSSLLLLLLLLLQSVLLLSHSVVRNPPCKRYRFYPWINGNPFRILAWEIP